MFSVVGVLLGFWLKDASSKDFNFVEKSQFKK